MKKPIRTNTNDDLNIVGRLHIPALDMETMELGSVTNSGPTPRFTMIVKPDGAANALSYKDMRIRSGTGYKVVRKFQNFGVPCDVIVSRAQDRR